VLHCTKFCMICCCNGLSEICVGLPPFLNRHCFNKNISNGINNDSLEYAFLRQQNMWSSVCKICDVSEMLSFYLSFFYSKSDELYNEGFACTRLISCLVKVTHLTCLYKTHQLFIESHTATALSSLLQKIHSFSIPLPNLQWMTGYIAQTTTSLQ